MGEHSKIEWTDATWNPVMGCTPVSEGCEHCYARAMIRRYAGRRGWPASADAVTLFPERLGEPLRWRKPRPVFVCSMADLFHESVSFGFITEVFDTMCAWRWPNAAARRSGDESLLEDPGHVFLLLTKRPERMWRWLHWVDECWPGDSPFNIARDYGGWPVHIWIGVTAENQQRADERIPLLLRVPAALHWVSVEPMLGPVDLSRWLRKAEPCYVCGGTGEMGNLDCPACEGKGALPAGPRLDWVVVVGETGPGARPMHPDWVRSLRDQCQAAGVPFFFKSWGDWAPTDSWHEAEYLAERGRVHVWPGERLAPGAPLAEGVMVRVGRRSAGHLLDGREWREFPRVALPRIGGGPEEPSYEE